MRSEEEPRPADCARVDLAKDAGEFFPFCVEQCAAQGTREYIPSHGRISVGDVYCEGDRLEVKACVLRDSSYNLTKKVTDRVSTKNDPKW